MSRKMDEDELTVGSKESEEEIEGKHGTENENFRKSIGSIRENFDKVTLDSEVHNFRDETKFGDSDLRAPSLDVFLSTRCLFPMSRSFDLFIRLNTAKFLFLNPVRFVAIRYALTLRTCILFIFDCVYSPLRAL